MWSYSIKVATRTQPLRLVANEHPTRYGFSGSLLVLGVQDSLSVIIFLVTLCSFFLFKNFKNHPLFFYLLSMVVVLFFTTVSFMFPRFSFIFMVSCTLVLTFLSFPYELFHKQTSMQHILLNKILVVLEKTLILDYLSVVLIKFFCTEKFYKRLFFMFGISVVYILTSRLIFLQKI